MLRVQMGEFLQLREFICRSSRPRFGAFSPSAHFLCKPRLHTLFGEEKPERPDRRNRTWQLSGLAWKIAMGRTQPASRAWIAPKEKGRKRTMPRIPRHARRIIRSRQSNCRRLVTPTTGY